MKKLTTNEQIKLLNSLPQHRKNIIKDHVKKQSQQAGNGWMTTAFKLLGPIAKEIGKFAFKKWIQPWISKKMGNGLRLAGDRRPRQHARK